VSGFIWSKKEMKLLRLASVYLIGSFVAAGSAFAQIKYDEGTHYKRLAKAQPVETGSKIEVIEFFSFGCSHCKDFEPFVQEFQKKAGADVSFRRIPVAFQPAWKGLSKAYFTLETMGEAEKLAPAVFEAVHKDGKKLENADVFLEWAASKGLDKAKVKSTYDGFSVDGKVRRADSFVKAYAIESVPTVIVDGKFTMGGNMLPNGHVGMPAAMEYVASVARKERK
jgi:protein dithiol oxidoreductase (disulfide-forming)